MEYLGFWVTHNGAKPKDKKYNFFETTDVLKGTTPVYRCGEILP